MGKIPNFTDSERLKTPKTDCVLKVYEDKEFYQLGFQVENIAERATLSTSAPDSSCLWLDVSKYIVDMFVNYRAKQMSSCAERLVF